MTVFQEADAYERKVMGWKLAVKEIHEKDQKLLAELRAKLSEANSEVCHAGLGSGDRGTGV